MTKAKIKFLNVDLDLESSQDLSILLNELGQNIIVLNNETDDNLHKVSMELSGKVGSPGYLINEYFLLFSNLSIEAKALWESCTKRIFDLGFESGLNTNAIHEPLPLVTLNQLTEMKAGIIITIYKLPDQLDS